MGFLSEKREFFVGFLTSEVDYRVYLKHFAGIISMGDGKKNTIVSLFHLSSMIYIDLCCFVICMVFNEHFIIFYYRFFSMFSPFFENGYKVGSVFFFLILQWPSCEITHNSCVITNNRIKTH